MPRYLIADMESAGHHARYVRWVVEAAHLIPGAEILVAGPRALLEHAELAPLRDQIVPIEVPIDPATAALADDFSIGALLKKHLKFRPLYTYAVDQARRGGPLDLIVAPYIDQTLYSWATMGTGFGRTPWLGISMLPMFHLPKVPGMIVPPPRGADRVREMLFRRLLRDRGLRAVITIDPLMREYASSAFNKRELQRLVYLPDPSVRHELRTRAASRKHFGIPDAALVVLLYGALHPRKGIQQLLRGASAPNCPPNVHVILAGRQSPEVQEILNQPGALALKDSGRLHVISTYVDDSLENDLLSAADVMWIGYSRFYRMSGILVLAARHGLTSIFTREGIIGYLGRRYKLGAEIDPDRTDSVTEALAHLAAKPDRYAESVQKAGDHFQNHSIANFQAVIRKTMLA